MKFIISTTGEIHNKFQIYIQREILLQQQNIRRFIRSRDEPRLIIQNGLREFSRRMIVVLFVDS